MHSLHDFQIKWNLLDQGIQWKLFKFSFFFCRTEKFKQFLTLVSTIVFETF